MSIFITAFAKNDQNIRRIFEDKLNSGELENALNISCDGINFLCTPNNKTCAADFICGNGFLINHEFPQNSRSSFIGDRGIVIMHGNIIMRNTELTDCDMLSACDVYKIISENNDCEAFRDLTTGDYSICYIKNDGSITAFSDRLSIEHLYYAQDSKAVYISNRIRLIRTMLESSHTDLLSLSYLPLIGSMVGNDTSVSEIKRIPQGGFAKISSGNISIIENTAFFFDDDEVSEECEKDFRQFVRKEINVCTNKMTAALKRCSRFSFALSGGKDSRSLLAMLMKTKYADKVSVFTNGYENHPDVVAAKMITDHYKLDHTVNVPNTNTGGTISIDYYIKKMLGSVFQTDGMIGLFNAKGYSKASPQELAFPGHINEVFRGFTHKNISINSYSDCVNYYKNIHLYDPLNCMKPILHTLFEQKLTARANSYASLGMSPADVNDTYFICDRLPNWTGYLLRTDCYSTPQVQVLNNDRLIKAFWRKGCCDMRNAELLHFLIISDFDKWLAECPFAVQTWSPDLEKWACGVNIHAPEIPLPKEIPLHGTWQHMINSSADVKIRFLEIIKSYDNSEIWDLYDKLTIEKALLSRNNSYTPMISLYGFLTMFFFHHKVELPMKMYNDPSAERKKTAISVDGEKTIYCYDNETISKFLSYDEFVNSGLSKKKRVTISKCAVDNIMNP